MLLRATLFVFFIIAPYCYTQDVQSVDVFFDSLDVKANQYTKNGKYSEAIKTYHFALQNVEYQDSIKNIGYHLHVADVYQKRVMHDSAYKYLKKVEKLIQNVSNDSLFVTYNHQLTNYYFFKGQTDKAMKVAFENLSIVDGLKNPNLKYLASTDLGLMFLEEGDLDKSEKYLNEARLFSKELNDSTVLNYSTINLGRLLFKKKEYLKAEKQFKLSSKYAFEHAEIEQEFISKSFLMKLYVETGRYFEAVAFKDRVMLLLEKLDYGPKVNKLTRKTKRLNEQSKDEDTPIDTALSEIKEMDKINRKNNTKIEAEFNQTLSQAYKSDQNVVSQKEKDSVANKSEQLQDSLYREALQKKYQELEVKYQTEKAQKESEKALAKSALLELENQKSRNRIWIVSSIAVILIMVSFLIWRKYKTERKAKQVITSQKNEIEQQKQKVEMLQKELHHRMKNNLSFIDLFINLAKGRFTNTAYQNKLNDLQNRMRSMFEVHKQLFKKEDVTAVKAKSYIDVLVENVKQAYNDKKVSIINNTHQDETLLANTSFPVGLIVNEFVTNSYKYAFEDRKNAVINISLTSDHKQYQLSLTDNGKGLPDDFDIDNLNSFGLETIQLLTQEYKGTFQLDGSKGMSMCIKLPKIAA